MEEYLSWATIAKKTRKAHQAKYTCQVRPGAWAGRAWAEIQVWMAQRDRESDMKGGQSPAWWGQFKALWAQMRAPSDRKTEASKKWDLIDYLQRWLQVLSGEQGSEGIMVVSSGTLRKSSGKPLAARLKQEAQEPTCTPCVARAGRRSQQDCSALCARPRRGKCQPGRDCLGVMAGVRMLLPEGSLNNFVQIFN